MRRRAAPPPGTYGVLRVEARAVRLTPRLQAGDIAVLDEVDLDGATARTLVARGVVAVVNVSRSTSGRYPNLGPTVLLEAGVPLLDAVGSALLSTARDGTQARLDGDTLWAGDERLASGTRHDAGSVAEAAAFARGGVSAQLADLSANAAAFVVDERELLVDGGGVPALATAFAGRHVLVIGPGRDAAQEFRALARYRRRYRPVLVAVDGGADVLLAAGHRPDLLMGDPTTMNDEALRSAREVCLRSDTEGLERVHDLAVPVVPFATRAAAEDMALLAAHHGGAKAVVLAGVPRDLVELLDRGRAATASTPLARVAAGVSAVSARTAATLTPRRSWGLPALCVLLAAGLGAAVGLGHEQLLDTWRALGS